MSERIVDLRYLQQVLKHTKQSATALLNIDNHHPRAYTAEEICHILVVAEFIKRLTPAILIMLANEHNNEATLISGKERETFIAACKVLKEYRNKFAHAILFANDSTNRMFVQNLHLAYVLNTIVDLVTRVSKDHNSIIEFSQQLQKLMEVSNKLYGAFSYEFAGSKDLYELFRFRQYLQTIITKFGHTKINVLGQSSYYTDALKHSWQLYTFLEENQYAIMSLLKSAHIVVPVHSVYLNLERALLKQNPNMLAHLIQTIFPLMIKHLDITIQRISYSRLEPQDD